MQKLSQSAVRDGNAFSRKGSIFGGRKSPVATRPSTSGGSIGTNGPGTGGDWTSFQASSASATSPSSASPGLVRKASSLASKSLKAPAFTTRRPSLATADNTTHSPERRSDGGSKSKAITSPKPPRGGQSASDRDSVSSTAPYAKMASNPFPAGRPGGSYVPGSFPTITMVPTLAGMPQSPTLETITYHHIQEMASKRISTLHYLRKAHEGRVYWFNTLLFNKPDLGRMPYFDPRKLARRATNYLLLGVSLPPILDLNSSNAFEFLRALNSLLAEFESYQQMHPPDGSTSSLSRARLPQMFKRATGSTGGKGRRASSATEIGAPISNDTHDLKTVAGSMSTVTGSSSTSFPSSENELLPGEEYTHLLTPSLPFDPDFQETFATLCDVLIDCYTKLMSLIAGPKDCGAHIAELFTKSDARVRKIIVQGVVKEFEESSRSGVRSEVAGVGRVVLGGLM